MEDLRLATETVRSQAQAAAEEAKGAERHVEEMVMQQKAAEVACGAGGWFPIKQLLTTIKPPISNHY